MTPKDAFYKVGTGIHRAIFNVSKGRIFGRAFGMPLIELVTTGRRSGKARATMLSVPIIDGERLVLVASFGGDDRHPAWYLNLRSNPEVRVTIAGSTRTMIARIATKRRGLSSGPRSSQLSRATPATRSGPNGRFPWSSSNPPDSHTSVGCLKSSPPRSLPPRGVLQSAYEQVATHFEQGQEEEELGRVAEVQLRLILCTESGL